MSFTSPPDFDPVQTEGTDIEDVGDSEFFLIRAPRGVDIRKLDGKKFSKSRVKQFKVEEGAGDLSVVYELTPFQGQVFDEQPLLKTDGKIKLGPQLSGLLSLTKSYTASDSSTSVQSAFLQSAGPVPMPEGLKVRFQPFGAGQPPKSPQKKHKEKHHLREKSGKSKKKGEKLGYESNVQETPSADGDDDVPMEDTSVFDLSEAEHSKSKKSKKRKSRDASVSDESPVKKKKKKRKSSMSDKVDGDTLEEIAYIDRSGTDRLSDAAQTEAKTSLTNGSMSPPCSIESLKKVSSSSGYSTVDTTMDTSDLATRDKHKKKKHKKEKRHKD